EPAARAARALGDGVGDRVAAAGTAGHVLDFDDTHAPSLAHLSAPTAPAALVLGADLGASVGDVLDAYAAGFEAMGALAAANHPGLRERGWHPTSVCGVAGAAVAAAALLGAEREQAVRLALLRAGGLHAAFGSDGKALQVGLAAAAGADAARLAAAGATASREVYRGFEQSFGAAPALEGGPSAVRGNWIKAYPCCLQTHGAIEAAAIAGAVPDGPLEVLVHPVSMQTAWRLDVATGLEAKFSIPYLTAYTLLYGPPSVASFEAVDPEARALGARIAVATDPALAESEAVLTAAGEEVARVAAALGSPARPMSEAQLAAKVRTLAGDRLDGALSDRSRPATDLVWSIEVA
ncbi:MAG: MmgE/PrpD family protein, partial [Thermoleophilaceae bacterium]